MWRSSIGAQDSTHCWETATLGGRVPRGANVCRLKAGQRVATMSWVARAWVVLFRDRNAVMSHSEGLARRGGPTLRYAAQPLRGRDSDGLGPD